MEHETQCTAEAAFDRVSDGSIVVDPDWKVVKIDEGATNLLETDASVEGRKLWHALPDSEDTDLGDRLREAMDDRKLTEFECYNEPLEAWLRVFCCPMTEGLTVYLKDVTRQQEAQREVEKMNEQLLLLNRIMRHDVRNDMAVVQGWSEELRKYVDGEAEEILDRVADSTRHAIRLTESARDYVEVLTESGSPDLEPLSLRKVLGEEIRRCRNMFGDASIEAGEIPDVHVDGSELLTSVFNNVIGNAVEHNDTEQPHVEVTVEVEPEIVRVKVADDGPGVPEDKRDAVFGRGPEGLDDPASGLGLHLVDKVVRGSGGDVWIEDNEPRGAVFVVELRRFREDEGSTSDE